MTMEKQRQRILDALQCNGSRKLDSEMGAGTLLSSSAGHDTEANAPSPVSMSAPTTDMVSSADWTEEGLVSSSDNFSSVHRISALAPPQEVLATIKQHEETGLPLIIEGWHKHPQWKDELFTVDGFIGDGEREVDVRNVCTAEDVKMPLRELVEHYQVVPKQAEAGEKQRFYGKDIECPTKWSEWLKDGALPAYIHPFGKNDMFSHLPVDERPETLMCYLGIGDTITPAHKDLCGSFGHNIMCYTADGGSAFWFMTATGTLHRDEPAMYFLEKLHLPLDFETHTATVQEFRAAPFTVHIAEQRLGDLVLVPPRSCHQVVNHGGITIKMSWSRMGLKSFKLSLYDELPLYHRVCRPEVYRVKLNIFHAAKAYACLLSDIDSRAISSSSSFTDQRLPISSCRDSSDPEQLVARPPRLSPLPADVAEVLRALINLLDDILAQEWHPKHMFMKRLEAPELLACSFCGADIFQSFFMCTECIGFENNSKFVCCPACYVEGRSCACEGSHMEPYQTWPFDDLIRERNEAAKTLNSRGPPRPFKAALSQSTRYHLFEAACHLRDQKVDRTKRSSAKTHLRCSTRTEGHSALATHVLRCGGCHANLCFKHILQSHDIHSSEAIAVHVRDKDQQAWHDRHTKTAKQKALLEKPGSGPDLAKRMVWAASKFTICMPLAGVRGKKGFYDDHVLVPGVDDETLPTPTAVLDEEMQDSETPKSTPHDDILMRTQDKRIVVDLRFDSPLTELSEDEMNAESRAESEPLPAPSPSLSQVRRGKHNMTTIVKTSQSLRDLRALHRRPVITSPAPKGTIPGSSPQVFHYVLIPTTPRKRPAPDDSTLLTTPTKKARTIVPPETPMTGTSSPPLSMAAPSSCTPPPSPSTSLSRTSTTMRTLVPVDIHLNASVPTVQTAAAVKARRVESSTRPMHLPEGARIGRPPKRPHHGTPLPGQSKSNPPEPRTAATSTSKTGPTERSTTTKSVPKDSSENRYEKLDRSVKDLTSRLDESMLPELRAFRKELDALKNDVAQINKFRAVVQGSQLEKEINARQARLEVSELNANMKRLEQELHERNERCKSLELQLEQRNATLADRDTSMNGLANMVGMFGHGIGAFIQNATNAETASNTQVIAQSQGGYWPRHRGSPAFKNANRMSVHHNFNGGSQLFHNRQSFYPRRSKSFTPMSRVEDDMFTGNQRMRAGPPRRPRAMSPDVNLRESRDEGRAPFRGGRFQSRPIYMDDRDGSFYRSELSNFKNDDENTYSRTHHSDYVSRNRSASPSRPLNRSATSSRTPDRAVTPPRTPDRAVTPPRIVDRAVTPSRTVDRAVTPPRTVYSRSSSRLRDSQVPSHTPEPEDLTQAPRRSVSQEPPFQVGNSSPHLDFASQDGPNRYQCDSLIRREP